MHRRAVLKLPLLLAAGAMLTRVPIASAAPTRWPAARANSWYLAQGWLAGANYVPVTASNQIEMWQPGTYEPRRIDGELQVARRVGMNTVRVFLHDQLWAQDRAGFLRRVQQFVTIAANQGIKPLFVLFDSCWDPHPKLGPQRAPIPGVHNSGWVQGPGADLIDDPAYLPVLRDYVTGVIGAFRGDSRILGWDLWNEPDNPAKQYRKVERTDKQQVVAKLLPQVFEWARSVDPIQPLTSGVWQGSWADPGRRSAIATFQLDNSDVITFHSYGTPDEFDARIDELTPLGRPMICTEYLAREEGSTVEGILPIAKKRGVGVYNWGLIAGAMFVGSAAAASAEPPMPPPPAPPNCSPADWAGVRAGVAAATSAYLFTHPPVNDFFATLAGQSRDEMRPQVQTYLDANPQVRADLEGTKQPAVAFLDRCGYADPPLDNP